MKSSQWFLLAGAFFGLAFATRAVGLGAPAPVAMTASQLEVNGSKPGRVSVAGQVVDISRENTHVTATIRGGDLRLIKVVITNEANNGRLKLGWYYRFDGEVLDKDTIVVSLPDSVFGQGGEIYTVKHRYLVKNHIAMRDHAFGMTRIAAPGVPDGAWELKVVIVDGGKQEAMFP